MVSYVRCVRFDFSCTTTVVLTVFTPIQQSIDCIISETRSLLVETTVNVHFSDQMMDERSVRHHRSYMVGCFRSYYEIRSRVIPLRTINKQRLILTYKKDIYKGVFAVVD